MASLSLQNAYHLYLANYAHTLPGRPEQHRRFEEKDTSRILAKYHSNSPTYVSASALARRDSALQLKKLSLDLEHAINPFLKKNEQGYSLEKSAYSLDDSIADIRYAPEYSTSPSETFSLEVSQLAKEQINTGTTFHDNYLSLNEGSYSFDLGFEHMNYEFQFEVSQSDSNISICEKVKDMINNAHIGIQASLTSNGNGTSYLEFATTQTGIEHDKDVLFTIADKSSPSGQGFIRQFGLDYIRQFPENAIFSIDGQPLEYTSNHVTLTNGFILSLKNTTTDPVAVGLKTDTETLADHINKCVSSYNKAIQDIYDFDPPSSSIHVLADKLAKIPGNLEEALSDLGISIENNRHLIFDSQLFKERLTEIENSDTEIDDFLSPVSKLSAGISSVLKKAIWDPITFTNSAIASYRNVVKNNYSYPYANSAYAGMYFNAYR